MTVTLEPSEVAALKHLIELGAISDYVQEQVDEDVMTREEVDFLNVAFVKLGLGKITLSADEDEGDDDDEKDDDDEECEECKDGE